MSAATDSQATRRIEAGTEDAVLVARNVWVAVKTGGVVKPIVRGGRLTVRPGKIVGLVGESGSGKTQFVRSIMGLSSLEPGVITGAARYRVGDGPPIDVLAEIDDYSPYRAPEQGGGYPVRQRVGWAWVLWRRRFRERLAALRELGVGFIFQNPTGALNPYLPVGAHLRESVRVARPDATRAEVEEGALHWLAQVHLPADKETLALYPHELSGGMAQRVMIALALAVEPHFLVADEPTTGLDSHIRREIMGLLHRIMAQGELSGIVISHDLPMVARLCDQLSVMYRGRIVEEAPIAALGDPEAPNHPYTRELKLRAEELSRGRSGRLVRATERSPDAVASAEIEGCPYRPRCLVVQDQVMDVEVCARHLPGLEAIPGGHRVACHASSADLIGLGSRRLVPRPELEEEWGSP